MKIEANFLDVDISKLIKQNGGKKGSLNKNQRFFI